MPDKPTPNKSIALRPETYAVAIEIKKLPQMLTEDGQQRSLTDVADEVFNFFLKAQKGKQ